MPYKGRFTPKNIAKYTKGDPSNIIFRSGLELRLMNYLDNTPSVLEWASEEPLCVIPYYNPLDRPPRLHRYFCDFWIKTLQPDGTIKERLVEVKPLKQTSPPTPPKTNTKKSRTRFISESKTWAVNEAKWTAARSACSKFGWDFLLVTERELKF